MSIITYGDENIYTDNKKFVVVTNNYSVNWNKIEELYTKILKLYDYCLDFQAVYGEPIKGKATCDEEDTFDLIKGKRLATNKCELKSVVSTRKRLATIRKQAETIIKVVDEKDVVLKSLEEKYKEDISNANH